MLRDEFLSLATKHGGTQSTAELWWAEVESHYREAHRRYHTLEHLAEMLDLLRGESDAVLAAMWFHDVIYDRRGSNEERSADVAREALTDLHFPRETIDLVERLILATKTHDPGDLPPETHVLLDADLAILGAPRERYEQYIEGVRYEYSWVPEPMFRAGRATVLRAFAEKERIFLTAAMRERFEESARENLAWELDGIED
jgi:predicted metal-dependent HD superfamily phosphohydrolase